MIWGDGALLEALANKYPPGARVTVHYDPSDPTTAVLETSDALARRMDYRFWPLVIGPLVASVVVGIINATP